MGDKLDGGTRCQCEGRIMTVEERLQMTLSSAIHLSDALAELVEALPPPTKENVRHAYMALEDVIDDIQQAVKQVAS